MSSKDEISAALGAIKAGQNKLLRLPLHTLTWSERVSLLQQIDELGKELVAFDRRLIGRLITQAPPAAVRRRVMGRGLVATAADLAGRSGASSRRGELTRADVDRPSA